MIIAMINVVILVILFILMLEIYEVTCAVGNSSEVQESVQITPFCDTTPGKLVITGYDVKLSEILKADGTFETSCGNSNNISVVHIFALHKIVIDQNVHAPGFEMFVLAPTWQVTTVSLIDLKGREGEFIPKPPPRKIGSDGENGKPGIPGYPGGNFFGMGETFIDGKYLTIDVSGGDGGPGQDGGMGGDGTEGRHALKSNLSLTCAEYACDTGIVIALDNKGEFTSFKCKEEYNYIKYDMFFLPPVSANIRECSYYIYGSEGVIAGAGGDGGVGGIGGYPGAIVLLDLFEHSGILAVNNTGKTGIEGKGNQGGLWAYTGWDVSFKKSETYLNEPDKPHISGSVQIKYIDSKTYSRQDRTLGVDGVNSFNIKDPVHGEPLDLHKILNLTAAYNKFVSDQIKLP